MGVAVGSIIATIMIHHMKNITTAWPVDHGAGVIGCMRRPILNNSSPGQAVYEPLMGSGTTLITAETTGRVCLGIELNPAYVDVAVDRWQRFTGRAAVLEGTDQTFDALRGERVPA